MIALPSIMMLILVAAVSLPSLAILRKRWQRIAIATCIVGELAMAVALAVLVSLT